MPLIVVVENIDKALVDTYGPKMHIDREKAIKGEQRGKWRIVVTDDQAPMKPTSGLMVAVGAQEAKRMKKTRIAWVQDNGIDWQGGAEFSSRQVMAVGEQCGFHIEMVTPFEFAVDAMEDSDLIVLNNLWRFSGEQMRAILAVLFERRVPYVKYEHDHRELTRPEFSRRLFEHAAANIFLSPVHRHNHAKILGAAGKCIPLAIDVEAYRPVPGVARVPGTALVCNVRAIKTWNRLRSYISEHPEIQFTILATNDLIRGKNIKTHNMIPPKKMPALYSAHEFLVHLPDAWCAGERVVLEAALCGCKIISNERVGHVSWGWDLEDAATLRERLIDAPFEFWRLVEGILSKRAAA